METKLYHRDHGFVITTDQGQINELLAKGAELVDKCSNYGNIAKTEFAEEVPTETEPTKPVVVEKRNPPMKRRYGH